MTNASPSGTDGAPNQAWAVTADKVNDVVHRLVVEPELTSRYSETIRLQKARFDERSQIPGTLEIAAHREGRVLHDSP